MTEAAVSANGHDAAHVTTKLDAVVIGAGMVYSRSGLYSPPSPCAQIAYRAGQVTSSHPIPTSFTRRAKSLAAISLASDTEPPHGSSSLRRGDISLLPLAEADQYFLEPSRGHRSLPPCDRPAGRTGSSQRP